MSPLLVVATFEFRYHLRQPTSLLFAALIFGQGVWYTYQPDNLYLDQNPALHAYTILSSLGIALATVAILLAGQSLTKDSAYKTTPYLYTLPISSRTHFAGRFLGTLSFALLLAIVYPFGILFTLAITATHEAFPLMALADGFVWLVIPNVFICVSIAFSMTVFLRGIWGAYVCLFLAVLYVLLTDQQMEAGVYSDNWRLLDPFAIGMIRGSLDNMPFLPDSDSLLSFSDILIINRLLWAGLALGALSQAESRFSFDTFAPKTPLQKPVDERSTANTYTRQNLRAIRLQFDGWTPLRTIVRVAQLECQALIRQPIFQLTVGLLLLLTLLLATIFNLNPDFPELPVTSRMTALREPMGLFIGLFLLVITGELIFQERTVGFWPIFDALPQPDAVLLSGKLLALMSIAALLTVVLFLTGVGLQLSNGFSAIDWPLYRDDLLMDGFFRYIQLIILGASVAVLVNNRLVSHVINLLIFSLLAFSYQVNSADQQRWLYSFLPGSTTYSDLLGYGKRAPLRLAFHGIWWGAAGILSGLFLLAWNRGISGGLRARLDHFRHQWSWQYALLGLGSFLIMGTGFWKLTQPTDITHEFISRYKTKTASFRSLSGKPIAITVAYHHTYQVTQMLLATQADLHKGETLFGAYPYSTVQIREVPTTQSSISSTPGNILISEKQGWIADNRQPAKLDYIDYLINRKSSSNG